MKESTKIEHLLYELEQTANVFEGKGLEKLLREAADTIRLLYYSPMTEREG